ncbi:hypothetical protein G7059_00980 [Erysipelothrix sp. HDW6A]|uniref:hypothetical protein n=1 Tax=Erysipelothrix sp. HDW6A TaxID=2714928 RepID=UPI001408E44C|nr:hypothetical protein [Erysipelothrix sp. HDW6A]QIK56512.1 hypothetical protein G7059_00980 [Erysipelothrix sp. HDW6A]
MFKKRKSLYDVLLIMFILLIGFGIYSLFSRSSEENYTETLKHNNLHGKITLIQSNKKFIDNLENMNREFRTYPHTLSKDKYYFFQSTHQRWSDSTSDDEYILKSLDINTKEVKDIVNFSGNQGITFVDEIDGDVIYSVADFGNYSIGGEEDRVYNTNTFYRILGEGGIMEYSYPNSKLTDQYVLSTKTNDSTVYRMQISFYENDLEGEIPVLEFVEVTKDKIEVVRTEKIGNYSESWNMNEAFPYNNFVYDKGLIKVEKDGATSTVSLYNKQYEILETINLLYSASNIIYDDNTQSLLYSLSSPNSSKVEIHRYDINNHKDYQLDIDKDISLSACSEGQCFFRNAEGNGIWMYDFEKNIVSEIDTDFSSKEISAMSIYDNKLIIVLDNTTDFTVFSFDIKK